MTKTGRVKTCYRSKLVVRQQVMSLLYHLKNCLGEITVALDRPVQAEQPFYRCTFGKLVRQAKSSPDRLFLHNISKLSQQFVLTLRI
jgi:hypothetical protein